jgi:hypothetical protein
MATDSPRWRVNRVPRFTALTIGHYMAADDGPRETLRRDMKYERIGRTTRYENVRRIVARFLSSPIRDMRILAAGAVYLADEIAEAASHEKRQNLRHKLRALNDFQGSLNAFGVGGWQLSRPNRIMHPIAIEGVRIHVHPTALARQPRPRGSDLIGAIIVDFAKGPSCNTDEARSKAEKSMKHSAVMLHERTEADAAGPDAAGRASPEHCVILHAHRGEAIAAPSNYRTMMKNVRAVCRDIARAWADIEPPPGFDQRYAVYRH